MPAAVPAGQSRSVELQLGDPAQLPHGEYLSVHARLMADGRCQAECRKGFGLLPRRNVAGPPEGSPYGLLG